MIKYIGNCLFSEFETSTPEECLAYLKDQEVIGFDVETSRIYPIGQYDEGVYKGGLDPYLSRICMVQIGTEEIQFIIDARVIDIRFLKEILEDKNILKVGHNLKFDAKHLLRLGIVLNGIHDTFLTERVLRNGYIEQFSLKALAIKYVGAKDVEEVDLFNQIEFYDDEEIEEELVIDKSIRTQFVDIWDNPFTIDQIKYGADDVIFPLKFREIQLKARDYPTIGINLENRFVRTLASIEYVGIGFDPIKWLDVADNSKILYAERLSKLNKWVEENHLKFCYHADLFSTEPTCKIQWSSSKQVIELFRYLNICPKEPSKQTKRMEWSVGAKALFKALPIEYRDKFQEGKDVDKIESLNDFILQYMLLKKTEQACTTFGKDWLKYVHPITRRVHTNYRQLMNTSRISSTNPNMQNIPSGHEYRECFVADTSKGKLICASDYEAQESKALADISNVEKMISFFRDGDPVFGSDMHSMSASQMQRVIRKDSTIIVTKKSDPKARNIAKALSFALSYGASAHSIKDTLGVSEEEAQHYIQAYFDGFPGLEENFASTKKLALQQGWFYLDMFTKKKYHFPWFTKMNEAKNKALSYYPKDKKLSDEEKQKLKEDNPELSGLWKEYNMLKGSLERRSLNYRIQGLCANVTKLACILIEDMGYQILNIVHDEILVECTESNKDQCAQDVKDCMIKAGSYFCKKVPMNAVPEVGTYWIH